MKPSDRIGDRTAPVLREGRRGSARATYRLLNRYAFASLLVAAATLGGQLARPALAAPDFVMVYLLAVTLVAIRHGRGPSFWATILSALAYNFFFAPPVAEFDLPEHPHVITYLMMLLIGLVIGDLVRRLRREEEESRRRADRIAALHSFSQDLGSAVTVEDVAGVTAGHVRDAIGSGAIVLVPDREGDLVPVAKSERELDLGAEGIQLARRSFSTARPLDSESTPAGGAGWRFIPLEVRTGPAGVLALSAGPGREERPYLDNFVRHASLALERIGLVKEAEAATLKAHTEEMRSSLLSAVSHDLRTPLAAITGAASSLREEPRGGSDLNRRDLIDTICEEADHLERLFENLLDMTRLEVGTVEVKREWVPLEEIVGAALYRLGSRFRTRRVDIDLPEDLPLISADPVLLGQALYNLLDNAAKYSPEGSPIDIRARVASGALELEVADRGSGLPPGSEIRVFEKFYRGAQGGVQGAGLGLAICRAIVQAHGGTITGENRPGGGARFRIHLPLLEGAPPVILDELEEPVRKEPGA